MLRNARDDLPHEHSAGEHFGAHITGDEQEYPVDFEPGDAQGSLDHDH